MRQPVKQLLKEDERQEMKEGQMVGLKLLQSFAKMRRESRSRQCPSGAEQELLKKEAGPLSSWLCPFSSSSKTSRSFPPAFFRVTAPWLPTLALTSRC